MKVILDTSIIFNNYYFNTPRFIGLFGYTKKTRGKVIIPLFVMQEVFKKYKEALEEHCKRNEQDNRILFNSNETKDTKQLENNYHRFFLKQVGDKNITVPTPKSVNSKKLFERALAELPPFDQSGRGIRDTLIWLSIVEILKSNPNEDYCFITGNTKDFGKINLHPKLIEDLGESSKHLFYFNSIEEFLSVYGEQISFIDKPLFKTYFDKNYKQVLALIDPYMISRSSIEDIPRYGDIDGIEELSINDIEVKDFYIYSSTESYYKVQVEVHLTLDVEVSLSDYDEIINSSSFGTAKGFTWCFIDFSLLINKKTKEIEIDTEREPEVYYP